MSDDFVDGVDHQHSLGGMNTGSQDNDQTYYDEYAGNPYDVDASYLTWHAVSFVRRDAITAAEVAFGYEGAQATLREEVFEKRQALLDLRRAHSELATSADAGSMRELREGAAAFDEERVSLRQQIADAAAVLAELESRYAAGSRCVAPQVGTAPASGRAVSAREADQQPEPRRYRSEHRLPDQRLPDSSESGQPAGRPVCRAACAAHPARPVCRAACAAHPARPVCRAACAAHPARPVCRAACAAHPARPVAGSPLKACPLPVSCTGSPRRLRSASAPASSPAGGHRPQEVVSVVVGVATVVVAAVSSRPEMAKRHDVLLPFFFPDRLGLTCLCYLFVGSTLAMPRVNRLPRQPVILSATVLWLVVSTVGGVDGRWR
ncbi:MAG: hypothetical protein ACYCV4_18340 [Dermatophilaceae bacterium]